MININTWLLLMATLSYGYFYETLLMDNLCL
uniref:Uncharacterized protein n=1 Tax=viral metagenome TaxID=1070528 RepID=A0A6C0H5J7_9ZZZZ